MSEDKKEDRAIRRSEKVVPIDRYFVSKPPAGEYERAYLSRRYRGIMKTMSEWKTELGGNSR